MISHTWFQSGDYSLLAHLHSPAQAAHDLGVVIVPPFGWEDVCSYRTLRELARTLADNGIPTFRFDLPATGDSSGTPRDPGLVAAWTRSVNDSIAELRRLTGVKNVAVIGIRLGAMLSVAAASTAGADIQQLVLWGPSAGGRALLRELRAFRNMEVSEFRAGQDPSPPDDQSAEGLESGGYLIMPETLAELEALDLTQASPSSDTKVLMLSRDALPCDAKLVRSLTAAGCKVEIATGQGLSEMMALPHEAVAPIGTYLRICNWLLANNGHAKTPFRQPILRPQTQCGSVRESIYSGGQSGRNTFGILARPAKPDSSSHSDWCVLFLNPGAGRHVGPNRMWVEAARRWAAKGIASLRLDLAGIGEGDGEQNLDVAGLYSEGLVEQVLETMQDLETRIGAKRYIAIGLCSGAFLAFHTAVRNPSLRAAILFNPRLLFWDPEVDRRRDLRRTSDAIRNSDTWMRLLSGHVKAQRFKDAISQVFMGVNALKPAQVPAKELYRTLDKIAKQDTRLTMIFTEGEPLLRELDEEGHLPPKDAVHPFRCVRIENAGHTFRPVWAQKVMHEMMDQEVNEIVPRDSI